MHVYALTMPGKNTVPWLVRWDSVCPSRPRSRWWARSCRRLRPLHSSWNLNKQASPQSNRCWNLKRDIWFCTENSVYTDGLYASFTSRSGKHCVSESHQLSFLFLKPQHSSSDLKTHYQFDPTRSALVFCFESRTSSRRSPSLSFLLLEALLSSSSLRPFSSSNSDSMSASKKAFKAFCKKWKTEFSPYRCSFRS